MSARGASLAQLDVARMKAPVDDPLMARFVAQLDEGEEAFTFQQPYEAPVEVPR